MLTGPQQARPPILAAGNKSQLPRQPTRSKVGKHVCTACRFTTRHFYAFSRHMKDVHMNKVTLVCTTCRKRFPCIAYYKRHIGSVCSTLEENEVCSFAATPEKQINSAHTDGRVSNVTTVCVENSSLTEPSDFETVDSGSSMEAVETLPNPDLLTKLSCLARHLESQHRCSKTAIDVLVNGVADILATAGCAIDVSAVENYKARKALYCYQGIYVAPQEVMLPSEGKAYFVPLKSLLENLLQHPSFGSCFRSKLDTSDSDLLKDFSDGTRFQKHPIASSHDRNLIAMLLYCDDIELANPLGMKRGSKGKLTIFYVSFVNIEPSERSKVSNIFLLAVGKSKDLKSGEAKSMLLEDFISTVNDLEKGCKLRTICGEETFFGLLLAYCGDSLACHNVGGFKESFSKNVRLACRTCTVPTAEFHNFHFEIECPLRTQAQYEGQLLQLENADSKKMLVELSAQFGINSRSFLAQITHFSVLTDLLYDPMHILLEGVVTLELSLFSKFMVREASWLTLSQLNRALSEFCFHRHVSKSDYPRSFESDFSFPCSASSSYVLLLHFLFMTHDFIPESLLQEPHCECILLLCIISQLLLSPVISPDALGDVELLIARHNKLFVELYGSEAFRPKLHMLLHMTAQIRRFGPSHHHWTMRFESKNSLPKSKKFWNFKNIPFSVADYFQMKMSSDLWEGPGRPKLSGAYHKGPSEVGEPFNLTPAFLPCGLDPNDVGKVAVSVPFAYVFSVKISISDVIVSSKNDEPMFGEVHKIVFWGNQLFFIVHVLVKVTYTVHMNAFVLLRTPHSLVVRPKSLFYPWPLFTYIKNDMFYAISKCLHESPLL